jgi:mannose-6-phosphate isomerase-like protein (cupin superfamily)
MSMATYGKRPGALRAISSATKIGSRPCASVAATGAAMRFERQFACSNEERRMDFETRRLPALPDIVAPDGSDVRVLLATQRGSMAHFELASGHASAPIRHRTVDEIWFVLSGRGEMWRSGNEQEDVVTLEPGVCVTIPVGTHFQFRAMPGESLKAVGVTMPPWPGPQEAVAVPGKWGS